MSIESDKCLICGQDAVVKTANNHFGTLNKCKKCGIITLESQAEDLYESEDGWKFRACLYYYFTQMKKRNNKPHLILDQKDITGESDHDAYNIISIQEIMNIYPRNFSELIDKILLNIEYLSDGVGSNIEINLDSDLTKRIFFINNALKAFQIIEMLEANRYIKMITYDISGNRTFSLISEGWNRIDKLHKDNEVFKKAFIAMCFDDDLWDIKVAIEAALDKTGYLPDILWDKEHNNEIMPEVYYGIKTSDFVVADLTGNRNGVYYEAGYGLALGKEVIITVNDNLKAKEDQPHFDVAHKSQIRYKNPADLKDRLIKRITATVGNLNANS